MRLPILNKLILGTVRVQANLAAFELSDDTLQSKYGLRADILDIDNEEHIKSWCDIINNSYTEFSFDCISAKSFLNDQKYFKNRATYLFTDSYKRGGILQPFLSLNILRPRKLVVTLK